MLVKATLFSSGHLIIVKKQPLTCPMGHTGGKYWKWSKDLPTLYFNPSCVSSVLWQKHKYVDPVHYRMGEYARMSFFLFFFPRERIMTVRHTHRCTRIHKWERCHACPELWSTEKVSIPGATSAKQTISGSIGLAPKGVLQWTHSRPVNICTFLSSNFLFY